MTDLVLEPRGPGGSNGRSLLSGNRGPLVEDGFDGDLWLNLTTFGLFKKVDGAWLGQGNLKGPATPGEGGKQGLGILFGTTAPATSLGRPGEFYIRQTATGLLFYGPKLDSGWPAGATALSGLISGAGAPDASAGLQGQLYVDTQNLIFYGPKTDTSWGAAKFLQPVIAGTAPPTNDIGLDGQLFIDVVGSALYGPKIAGAWPPGTSLIGATPLKPIVPWATGTVYSASPPASYVRQGKATYQCLVAHTSGTFLTDLSAGRWGLITQDGNDGAGSGTVQTDGAVTAGRVPIFSDSSGTKIADSGLTLPVKATPEQAQAGTDNAAYMTAALVAARLDPLLLDFWSHG